METPEEQKIENNNEMLPKKEYEPKERKRMVPEDKKEHPFAKVIWTVITVVFCSALLYFMGYKIAEEALVHTAYEIAAATVEQTTPENTPELYQQAVSAKASQIAAEKQKDHAFILKSVHMEIIPPENAHIRIITVSLESRFLFSKINASWWARP